jgi:dipeptidyl aminopeptidase/acylaminoacyl peptidase
MGRLAGLCAALLLALTVVGCRAGDERAPREDRAAHLIPRAHIFGDPARTDAALNPQGDRIAFLAPAGGYLNVWVMPTDAANPANGLSQARPYTRDRRRGIRKFLWAETGRHILYLQDASGDENWRLRVVDLANGDDRDLTPLAGVQARIVGTSPGEPNIVMAALNDRDRAWHDLYRIDILSGDRELVARNANASRRFADYYTDRGNQLRLALRPLDDGSSEIWSRSDKGAWSRLITIPFEDAASTRFLTFESSGDSFLMLDSMGLDRAALVRIDAATGRREVLGASAHADVVDAWVHPLTQAPQAFAADYLRLEWDALDDGADQDLAYLDANLVGDASVISRSRDDSRWIVEEEGPRTPARTWLYQRSTNADARSLKPIFDNRPVLQDRRLAAMIPVEIPARDGLTLVSYLTLPVGSDSDSDGVPETPLPLVLVVHGGPWARDSYGYNPFHQWLADRGYAALSVNFRGSTGFGKVFLNAGNGEWGAKMQRDLRDAAAWAVERKIARRDQVAIMGQSYGGYAALAGLAFTPTVYACGVSVVGPSNLVSLLNSIPPYWSAYRAELYKRVGHPVRDAAMLRERSPLFSAGRINQPLLIAQGARDPRVARTEADQLMGAVRGRNEAFVYLLYPDEGHSLTRPQNRLSFYAAAERFLGKCLGGPVQPLADDFRGASARTLAGLSYMPDLRSMAPPLPVQATSAKASDAARRYRRARHIADPDEYASPDLPIATRSRRATSPEEADSFAEPSAGPLPEQ